MGLPCLLAGTSVRLALPVSVTGHRPVTSRAPGTGHRAPGTGHHVHRSPGTGHRTSCLVQVWASTLSLTVRSGDWLLTSPLSPGPSSDDDQRMDPLTTRVDTFLTVTRECIRVRRSMLVGILFRETWKSG